MLHITIDWLVDTFGISKKTARRWHKSKNFPVAVVLCARLLLERDLGTMCPEWEGWKLRSDALYSPENEAFTWGDVRAIHITRQLINALHTDLADKGDKVSQQAATIADLQAQITDPVLHRIVQLKRELSALESTVQPVKPPAKSPVLIAKKNLKTA